MRTPNANNYVEWMMNYNRCDDYCENKFSGHLRTFIYVYYVVDFQLYIYIYIYI